MKDKRARAAWDAYRQTVGGVSRSGDDLPDWEDLEPSRQSAWRALSRAGSGQANGRGVRVYGAGNKRGVIEIYTFIGEGFFSSGVTPKSVSRELKELGDITQLDVHINSPGGSVFDGMAIYNIIKRHPANVTVFIDGLAASMASVIAMVGDEIVMPENTLMMIHDPWSIAVGNADDLEAEADLLRKITGQIADIYTDRSESDRDDILQWMKDETWMTGAEAVERGFADTLEDEVQIAACIDLDQMNFKNAPDLSALNQPAPSGATSVEAEETMPTKTKPNAPKATGAPIPETDPGNQPEVDEGAIRKQALADEKKRQADIRQMFAPHREANQELLDACLEDQECTAEAASKKLLAALGQSSQPVGSGIEAGADAHDKFIAGASSALYARARVGQREAGNEYNGMRLADMVRRCLATAGHSVSGMSDDAVARAMFSPKYGMGTSDFPLLTSNLANKVLLKAFEEVPQIWPLIANVGEVSDFKVNTRLTRGSFGNLQVKQELGEYKRAYFGEDSATIQAATKGLIATLSRPMIVNDDLGAFVDILRMLGAAAGRTVNADVLSVLISGNAPDGTALFHADHSNLAGSGAAISGASVSAGKAAMRKQKDIDDNAYLDIMAELLVVPVALESEAKTFVASETDPSKSNSKVPNIHRNTLEVISHPILDAASATAWYLLANPNQAPVVEVAFLDGNQTPFTEENINFETDAIDHKVRFDYGTAGREYRGGWKNPGA